MLVARVYFRVSTKDQDLNWQDAIIDQAKNAGYYVAGVYLEKASGARASRPELLRLITDLQKGDVVIAEKINRISRLPLAEAEKFAVSIRSKEARLAVPGIVDLTDLADGADGMAKIVLQSVQDTLLKLAVQMAHDNYEERRERQAQGIRLARSERKYAGRQPDRQKWSQIIELRERKHSIAGTALIVGCSISQVKRIWALHQAGRKASE